MISQVHTHTYTLFNTHDNTDDHGRWRYIMFLSQVHTHKKSLFKTPDNTSANADGNTPY